MSNLNKKDQEFDNCAIILGDLIIKGKDLSTKAVHFSEILKNEGRDRKRQDFINLNSELIRDSQTIIELIGQLENIKNQLSSLLRYYSIRDKMLEKVSKVQEEFDNLKINYFPAV